MKIKNYELKGFMGFLMSFELNARDSRLRTRFVRLLNEYANRLDEEHNDLIKIHSNLDEDGNPIIIEDDVSKRYDITDKKLFNVDYNKLLAEDNVILITEERKEMFNFVKSVILDCDKTFKGEEAFMYDRFCEIVEEVEIEE